MSNVLIKGNKYQGQYVALKDFDNPVVIAHGIDPQKVHKQAVKKGYKEPVIMHVPDKNMAQIYLLLNEYK